MVNPIRIIATYKWIVILGNGQNGFFKKLKGDFLSIDGIIINFGHCFEFFRFKVRDYCHIDCNSTASRLYLVF